MSLCPLDPECQNRVILGQCGITEDAAKTISYPAFPIPGDCGIYEEIGGYFQQSAYQMLTKNSPQILQDLPIFCCNCFEVKFAGLYPGSSCPDLWKYSPTLWGVAPLIPTNHINSSPSNLTRCRGI